MKNIPLGCLVLISIRIHAQSNNKINVVSNRTIPFDNDWLFAKDNIKNAEQINYNDAKWSKLDLPHHWKCPL